MQYGSEENLGAHDSWTFYDYDFTRRLGATDMVTINFTNLWLTEYCSTIFVLGECGVGLFDDKIIT